MYDLTRLLLNSSRSDHVDGLLVHLDLRVEELDDVRVELALAQQLHQLDLVDHSLEQRGVRVELHLGTGGGGESAGAEQRRASPAARVQGACVRACVGVRACARRPVSGDCGSHLLEREDLAAGR